jgi:RNA polymerase sigma-70 factor (ECF subfamily)
LGIARDELDTPEKLALTEEMCIAVVAAIEGLCEQQRSALVLREFHGFSYSQIASAMACPVGTVRSRVYRAREAIDNQVRHVPSSASDSGGVSSGAPELQGF